MLGDRTLKSLLFVNAVLLGLLSLRPYFAPSQVQAQTDLRNAYVEPGVFMLRSPDGQRQVLGKVMINLRTGDVWGFPTLSSDPYPTNAMNKAPQTSHPFLLGRFALEDMDK